MSWPRWSRLTGSTTAKHSPDLILKFSQQQFICQKNQYLPDSEEEEQSQGFAEMMQAESLTLDKAEEEEQSQELAEMKQAESLTLGKAMTRADLWNLNLQVMIRLISGQQWT